MDQAALLHTQGMLRVPDIKTRTSISRFLAALVAVLAACTSASGDLDTDNADGVGAEGSVSYGPPIRAALSPADAAAESGETSPPLLNVRGLLPGRSSRRVLHEQVNEAENIDFTEDGRLFVSGGEDIVELSRAADGTFNRVDYFHEDCLVEGIVHSGRHLYGVCTDTADDRLPSYLIAGELTERPVLRRIASLQPAAVPNGMTVDSEGRIYITYWVVNQIVRVTLASPLELSGIEVWADNLSLVNGIKHVDNFMYVTTLDAALSSHLLRIPILPDGRAGEPQHLYERALTVFDDLLAFEGGLIVTDFLQGTLIFWEPSRGVYAETPAQTFFGPTSLAQGRPPMFNASQLIVAEKGALGVRDEVDGDLVSAYQLPLRYSGSRFRAPLPAR
jgi:hypothetical protein